MASGVAQTSETPGIRARARRRGFSFNRWSLLALPPLIFIGVLFAYPLHAPGRHDAWRERTAHWPRIRCPVLLLSGESDPFARIDLIREAVDQLPNATLVTYPGVGHSVGPVLEEAVGEVAAFMKRNT